MKRVQRKRDEGWRKSENTKIVDRTSRWGNPVKLEKGKILIWTKYRSEIKWKYYKPGTIEDVIEIYKSLWTQDNFEDSDLQYWADYTKKLNLDELKGFDSFTCFCPLDAPCHADILIELLKKEI